MFQRRVVPKGRRAAFCLSGDYMAIKQMIEYLWEGKSKRSASLSDSQLRDLISDPNSGSGENVNATTAMRISAVFACVRVLSETISSLPVHVYRRNSDGSKTIERTHYLYPVLHREPFPGMTSMQFRETMTAWVCLYGNAYARILRNGKSGVVALQPWHPDLVRVTAGPVYRIATSEGSLELKATDVLHLKGLTISADGLQAASPITQAREQLGLALAMDKHGSRFFGNSARPGGVLEHPAHISKEASEELKKSWNTMYQGTDNAYKTAVLQEGMTFKPLSVSNDDAQWLDARKFSVTDIARIFRVPPHMIGDLERATFSNVEQQSIDFVVHTIRPWLVRWEQEILRCLFPPEEQDKFFAEFVVDGLLRGDIASRYAAYAVGRNWGWLSANDVRGLENQNPVEGGDIYLQPLNMVPAGTVSGLPPTKEPV